MPGIKKINAEQEEQKANSGFSGGSELILNADGDQALIAVVATGDDDDDDRIATFYRHSYNQGTTGEGAEQWRFVFCKKSVDEECALCNDSIAAQKRFGFWAYVYAIIRKAPGTGDDWKPVVHAGEKLYQREIKDFRIVSLPFGRNSVYWNQFCGIYYENGAMNKSILRVKRTGSRRETVWNVSLTNKAVDWKAIGDGGNKLESIKDFLMGEEQKRKEQREAVSLIDNSVEDKEDSKNGDLDTNDLF